MQNEPENTDIRSVLKQMGVATDPPPEDADPDPLSAMEDFSDAQMIEIDEDPDAEPENAPVRRTGSGLMSKLGDDQDKRDPWVRIVPGLGRVTVSEADKEAFEDAFFAEQRYRLTIPMKVGKGDRVVEIECRSMLAYERELIARAVIAYSRDESLRSPGAAGLLLDHVTRLNYLMVVVRVGDEAVTPFEVPDEDMDKPVPEASCLQDLQNRAVTVLNRRHPSQVALIAKALRVFEVKCDILEDALINQDFTESADSV